MIAKAVKGKGFRGALAYDLGKGDAHLLDTNMAAQGVRGLAAEFGAVRKLRPNLEKAVLHVSLSAAPGERLSDRQWEQIGRQYLGGMGFLDNQYLITRHTDTEHEHIHILANRISPLGQVISDSHDWRRQEVLMRDIEKQFGLQKVAPSIEAERRAPTKGEIEKLARTGETSTRVRLQLLCDEAVKVSSTYTAYQASLEARGVELNPVVQQEGAKLSGLMYRLDGVLMKGSDLGKGYSPAGLARRGVSYEQSRDAAAIRRGQEQGIDREAGQPGGRAGPPGQERGAADRGRQPAPAGPGQLHRADRPGAEQSAERYRPGPASRLQPEPGLEPARDQPLPRGDRQRGADGVERGDGRGGDLHLAGAGPDLGADGPEGGGRAAEERRGGDREREREHEAEQREVAGVRLGLGLQRLEAERDERLRRVLARAKDREARRQEALQRLAEKRPEAPNGLLAVFKQAGHEQAVAAWERAKALGAKLVQEARQLAERLRDIAAPERVRQWARELARRTWPQAVAEQVKKPEQEPQRPDPIRRPAVPVLEHLREPFRDWQRAKPLIEKAKTQPLDLFERRDVVNGWDSFARLVDAGHVKMDEAQRSGLEQVRHEARLQVIAAEFLALPADEMVHAYPNFKGVYGMLETVEQRSKAAGRSQAQREHLHERSRQKIATAIEKGQNIRLKDLVDFERPVRQAQDIERPAPKQDCGRER